MADTIPTVDLPDWIGPVAAEEFERAPDYAKRDLVDWIFRLPTLADEEFLMHVRYAIYESALCSRFRGNFEHIHCKATVCFNEARRRLVAAGHDKDCRGPSLYSRAHAEVMRSHGYEPSPEGECDCKIGDSDAR